MSGGVRGGAGDPLSLLNSPPQVTPREWRRGEARPQYDRQRSRRQACFAPPWAGDTRLTWAIRVGLAAPCSVSARHAVPLSHSDGAGSLHIRNTDRGPEGAGGNGGVCDTPVKPGTGRRSSAGLLASDCPLTAERLDANRSADDIATCDVAVGDVVREQPAD